MDGGNSTDLDWRFKTPEFQGQSRLIPEKFKFFSIAWFDGVREQLFVLSESGKFWNRNNLTIYPLFGWNNVASSIKKFQVWR